MADNLLVETSVACLKLPNLQKRDDQIGRGIKGFKNPNTRKRENCTKIARKLILSEPNYLASYGLLQ